MTNREAILRLSVNTGDGPAMTSLHDNNTKAIRAAVARYFGVGPVADKAESVIMQRTANHARYYKRQANPEGSLARRVNTQCDSLRDGGLHDKTARDEGQRRRQ